MPPGAGTGARGSYSLVARRGRAGRQRSPNLQTVVWDLSGVRTATQMGTLVEECREAWSAPALSCLVLSSAGSAWPPALLSALLRDRVAGRGDAAQGGWPWARHRRRMLSSSWAWW